MSKKYRNPISKPVTITISKWEYDALKESAYKLGVLELLENDKSYQVTDMLQMMMKREGK